MTGCGATRMTDSRPIVHFYHVFADGVWQDAAVGHVRRLSESGLLDRLDWMFVGVVGSEDRRAEVGRVVPGEVLVEAESGWEQVTLSVLRDWVEDHDGRVLYAHTKGAWSQSRLAEVWREKMTRAVVDRWRECVQALDSVDVAGPFWYRSSEPEHKDHGHFFAGNFWWGRAEYLRTLPAPRLTSRFDAEGWVGLGLPSRIDVAAGERLPWQDIR